MPVFNLDRIDKELGKVLLSEFLGFLKYKVDHDALTLEEERAIIRILERDLPLAGTADEIADYFHQSSVNVRSVIHRNIMPKPKRRVLYSFLAFCKIAPKSWLK